RQYRGERWIDLLLTLMNEGKTAYCAAFRFLFFRHQVCQAAAIRIPVLARFNAGLIGSLFGLRDVTARLRIVEDVAAYTGSSGHFACPVGINTASVEMVSSLCRVFQFPGQHAAQYLLGLRANLRVLLGLHG